MMNQKRDDLGIPNRFKLRSSRSNSAMLQSMQAAQQQNDEANAAFNAGMAAALQTEINANN